MQLRFKCILNASSDIAYYILYKNKCIQNVFKFEKSEATILISRCILNMPN